MNPTKITIVNMPHHFSSSRSCTCFSYFSQAFTTSAPPLIFGSPRTVTKFKHRHKTSVFSLVLKNGAPKNHRSRFQRCDCTNLEKSGANSIETGSSSSANFASSVEQGRQANGSENLDEVDGRNPVSKSKSNFADFGSNVGVGNDKGSGNLEELSGRKHLGRPNFEGNTGNFNVFGSETSEIDNGYEQLKAVGRGDYFNGAKLDENIASLGAFGFTANSANCDSAAGNDGGALSGNGSRELGAIEKSYSDSGVLEKISANLEDFGSKCSGNCDSAEGSDGGTTYRIASENLGEVDREKQPDRTIFDKNSRTFGEVDRGNHLGWTVFDKNSENLGDVDRGNQLGRTVFNRNRETFGEMDGGNELGRPVLDKKRENLAALGFKTRGTCDTTAGNDENGTYINSSEIVEEKDSEIGSDDDLKEALEDTSLTNSGKEQSDSSVTRKVISPYSFDPFKLKKDKGLLDDEELEMLKLLENFEYKHRFDHGLLVTKVMNTERIGDTEELLTDSFAELMWGPLTYRPLLRLTVREHMIERRAFIPHAATLVGLYTEGESGECILGGTVELSFNSEGSAEFPPTPIPPKGAPYLCNMAVNKSLRRRGIGWHLLKASEELVTQMGSSEMYLHCRIIDKAPFNMYTKAGYNVAQTDNIFALLSLQRRRHLMYKKWV